VNYMYHFDDGRYSELLTLCRKIVLMLASVDMDLLERMARFLLKHHEAAKSGGPMLSSSGILATTESPEILHHKHYYYLFVRRICELSLVKANTNKPLMETIINLVVLISIETVALSPEVFAPIVTLLLNFWNTGVENFMHQCQEKNPFLPELINLMLTNYNEQLSSKEAIEFVSGLFPIVKKQMSKESAGNILTKQLHIIAQYLQNVFKETIDTGLLEGTLKKLTYLFKALIILFTDDEFKRYFLQNNQQQMNFIYDLITSNESPGLHKISSIEELKQLVTSLHKA